MRIIRSLKSFSLPDRPVYLTLGNFDGIHLGHQAIIQKMVFEAREVGGVSVLFTFYKHPLTLLAPSRRPLVITPLKTKITLLERIGVEYVICLRFTRQFARISAEEFIERILYKTLRVKKLFTGSTYSFGRDRQGSPQLLQAKADQYGYIVEIIDSVVVDETVSSSTHIRGCILSGQMEQAHTLLGRPYSMRGRVVHGTRKGKDLGIKTATLNTRSDLLPPDGVYAVRAKVLGKEYLALANIGCQPTFGIHKHAIEVNILDFNRDIYGELMEIYFLKHIRAEKHFESVAELREQIAEDIRFVSSSY